MSAQSFRSLIASGPSLTANCLAELINMKSEIRQKPE